MNALLCCFKIDFARILVIILNPDIDHKELSQNTLG